MIFIKMPHKRMSNGVFGYMLVSMLLAVTKANPVPTTEVDTEVNTEVFTPTAIPRDRNPVYNVWEYAYIHDGSIDTRNAAPAGVASDTPVAQSDEDNGGSQCLWAIVSCCNAQTNYERDNCFEALGCSGAWFQNLCSEEYITVANNRVSSIFSGGFARK